MRGRWASTAVVATAIAVAVASGSSPVIAVSHGCQDPSSAGYSSHECKVERLRARPFAVVAVVDTGINPYHVDFRLPPDDDMVGVHPSEYIAGYPADAERMALSFNAPSPAAAHAKDAAQWARSAVGSLMWVDGTVIVGGKGFSGADFFDGTVGHGTAVASIAGGRVVGPNFENTLIVAVDGTADGIEWASRQSWIDVITNSWSTFGSKFDTVATSSYNAVAAGKIVCFASGNLSVPLWFWSGQGPSWHVNVGAVDAADRREPYYTGWPNDVLGITNVPAARHDSMTETRAFGGTSGATPAVCGLIAKTISQARARLGDTTEGPHVSGALAVGSPGSGATTDGRLVRAEIEDAVQSTAVPSTSTPPAHYVRGGYGIVDRATIVEAAKVLFGEKPRPSRPDEDFWINTTNTARDVLWGSPPP